MHKISISPAKPVSAGAIVMLIFLLLFGIAFGFLVGNALIENDAPPLMITTFMLIIILWVGTVLFMLIYHAKNFRRPNGLSLIDINADIDTNNKDFNGDPLQRFVLETLKKEGLINEEEYNQKRVQIMRGNK